MTGTTKSRQRIARVRSVQHRLALVAEQHGRSALDALAQRSALIARLHATMAVVPGQASGAEIARTAELASRFAVAGISVAEEKAIALSRLARLTDQRIASDRDREGAERLADAAAAAARTVAEKRASRHLSRRKTGLVEP